MVKVKYLTNGRALSGNTPDENPVLGAVPGKPGLWICAGFTGHGMALAFRSADAVSSLVLGHEEEVNAWLPRSFSCGRKGNCRRIWARNTSKHIFDFCMKLLKYLKLTHTTHNYIFAKCFFK